MSNLNSILSWKVEDKPYPEVGDNVKIIASLEQLAQIGVHPDITDEHWREQTVLNVNIHEDPPLWGQIVLSDTWSYPLSKWKNFAEII